MQPELLLMFLGLVSEKYTSLDEDHVDQSNEVHDEDD